MEEAPENGKELSYSAHANGTNERTNELVVYRLWKRFYSKQRNVLFDIYNSDTLLMARVDRKVKR